MVGQYFVPGSGHSLSGVAGIGANSAKRANMRTPAPQTDASAPRERRGQACSELVETGGFHRGSSILGKWSDFLGNEESQRAQWWNYVFFSAQRGSNADLVGAKNLARRGCPAGMLRLALGGMVREVRLLPKAVPALAAAWVTLTPVTGAGTTRHIAG